MKRLNSLRLTSLSSLVAAFLLVASCSIPAFAQNRVSDKDVAIMMDNLHSDAGRFQSAFDDSIKKSTIRHTSQEKEARELVERFQKSAEGMYNHFKDTKKADVDLPNVLTTAREVDTLLRGISLNERTNAMWAKVVTELNQIADAFNIPGLGQPR